MATLGKETCIVVYDGMVDEYVDAQPFLDWLMQVEGSQNNEWAIKQDRERLIDVRATE